MTKAKTDWTSILREVGGDVVILRTSQRTRVAVVEYGGADLVVRKLRGKKCRTRSGLFDEFGAAWQVFYDFGENWHALDEMLHVLDDWLPAGGYVCVIEHAEELLLNPESLGALLLGFHRAGQYWSQPISDGGRFDRPARPFHLVLESSDPALDEAVAAVGVGCSRVS